MIIDEMTTIYKAEDHQIKVLVRRDRRLKKSARWSREGPDQVLLRVPVHLSRRQIDQRVSDVADQVTRQRQRAASLTDADLQDRAECINQRYFGGQITWESIRWVNNMNKRLGSCTNGGPTDGHIRISERIRNWPDWVVDYVIAHELAHRIYANHSSEFWRFLRGAYPRTDIARGFIEGVAFAQHLALREDDVPEN